MDHVLTYKNLDVLVSVKGVFRTTKLSNVGLSIFARGLEQIQVGPGLDWAGLSVSSLHKNETRSLG